MKRAILQEGVTNLPPKKFCEIDSWGLYHKTYYGRNLRISVISLSVCPWEAFPV
jgi:hypothetical protein